PYGRPISSQYDVTKFFDLKRYRPTFYIQDNWRVTPRLTLNLGVRDEIVTPWKERHNRLAVFDPSNGGNLVPVGTPGFPDDTVTDARLTNIGPRFGFAYSITPKTVLRGGFGIFYAYQTYNSNPQAKNAPFNGSVVVSNATGEAGFSSATPISAGLPASPPRLFPAPGRSLHAFPSGCPPPSPPARAVKFDRQRS